MKRRRTKRRRQRKAKALKLRATIKPYVEELRRSHVPDRSSNKSRR